VNSRFGDHPTFSLSQNDVTSPADSAFGLIPAQLAGAVSATRRTCRVLRRATHGEPCPVNGGVPFAWPAARSRLDTKLPLPLVAAGLQGNPVRACGGVFFCFDHNCQAARSSNFIR